MIGSKPKFQTKFMGAKVHKNTTFYAKKNGFVSHGQKYKTQISLYTTVVANFSRLFFFVVLVGH
jgi:hypothetical protein